MEYKGEFIKVCKRCKREMRKKDFAWLSKEQFLRKVYCSAECRSPQLESSAKTKKISLSDFAFDLWLQESPPENFKLWLQKNEQYIKIKHRNNANSNRDFFRGSDGQG